MGDYNATYTKCPAHLLASLEQNELHYLKFYNAQFLHNVVVTLPNHGPPVRCVPKSNL